MPDIEGPLTIYVETDVRFVDGLRKAIYGAIEQRLREKNECRLGAKGASEASEKYMRERFIPLGYLDVALEISSKNQSKGELFDAIRVKFDQEGYIVSHDEFVGGSGWYNKHILGFCVIVLRHALVCEEAEIAEHEERRKDVQRLNNEAYWFRHILETCAETDLENIYRALFRGNIVPPEFVLKTREARSSGRIGGTTFAYEVAQALD